MRFDSNERPSHVGTSRLINDDVYDAAGNRLARIEELILDTRSGSVRFVVLGIGGFLGMGRERFAVPWHVLAPDIHDGPCIADMALLPFTAVPVPEDDRWLQRTPGTSDREIPQLLKLLQKLLQQR